MVFDVVIGGSGYSSFEVYIRMRGQRYNVRCSGEQQFRPFTPFCNEYPVAGGPKEANSTSASGQ
jgi:hypothetical protein